MKPLTDNRQFNALDLIASSAQIYRTNSSMKRHQQKMAVSLSNWMDIIQNRLNRTFPCVFMFDLDRPTTAEGIRARDSLQAPIYKGLRPSM